MIDLRAWLNGLDPVLLHIATFGLLFLEGMGIPGIPGVLPMLAQLGPIEAGRTTLAEAILWGSLGNWLGSVAGYAVGRWGGRFIPERHRDKLKSEQAAGLLRRYGPLAVVVSRTIGALRTPVTLGAGAMHYPLPAYIFFSLIGAFIHIGVWQWLLWRFGAGILPHLEQVGGQALAVAGVLLVLALLGRWWWVRRQAALDTAAPAPMPAERPQAEARTDR